MRKTIIAIDPGKNGGIAWQHGDVCGVKKMPPTEKDIFNLLSEFVVEDGTCVYLEKVHIMPGGGARGGRKPKGASDFMKGYGFLRGVLTACGYRIEDVTPQKWQKKLALGGRKDKTDTEWKNHLKAAAQRLYPQDAKKITLATADALLILEYARQQEAQR